MQDYKKLPYRLGATAMVFNKDDKMLVVQLCADPVDYWGFPGGGREKNESGEQTILRELSEELGLHATDFDILAKSKVNFTYDFSDDMRQKRVPITLQYRGQSKERYFLRFLGDTSKITINSNEVRACDWISASEFKARLLFEGQYKAAVEALAEYRTLQV